MDLGFETIGNATLICHDRGPVLVTDPWIAGPAYFGSWTHSHVIPEEQMANIRRCRYVWVSHGHPDHLSVESLALLRSTIILLPDHVGGRIAADLRALNFQVVVLQDRRWTELSPRLRVLSISDYNQDGVLLVDLGGTLLVNLNDAADHGWGSFVKRTIRSYDETFLLKLFGYGDVDMFHFINEDGQDIEPIPITGLSVGKSIQVYADGAGVRYVVPFSSMHKYQRSDSVWARRYTTELKDYGLGFSSSRATLLPAFIGYDILKAHIEEIRPSETPHQVLPPEMFGDNWNDPLDQSDVQSLRKYFVSIQHLGRTIDFIIFRVGGKEYPIELSQSSFKTGIIFESPRHSLMEAVTHEAFDDLLIGNFMKTCLIGDWPKSGLYPYFSPYVAKYADNGRAKSDEELYEYFRMYRNRAPADYLRHCVEIGLVNAVRIHISAHSPIFNVVRRASRRTFRRL